MSRRRLRNGAAQRRRAKRKANGEERCRKWSRSESQDREKVGRRTKCTEDYVPRFLERIEAGQSVPAAAAVAGLHISTVMEWLAREWENPGGQFAEFAAAYARAKSVGENRLVSQIVVHGAKDWRATAWLLERRHPDR